MDLESVPGDSDLGSASVIDSQAAPDSVHFHLRAHSLGHWCAATDAPRVQCENIFCNNVWGKSLMVCKYRGPREFDESEDMLERDLEDLELE